MSVYNPDIEHLTWLGPWLEGLPLPVQSQTLADAWDAVKDVAFDHFGDIDRPSLIDSSAANDNKAWLTPVSRPNPAREKKWANWLLQTLRADPSAL